MTNEAGFESGRRLGKTRLTTFEETGVDIFEEPSEVERPAQDAPRGWFVDAYCSKHNGYHLQNDEGGTDFVLRDMDSAGRLCDILNGVASSGQTSPAPTDTFGAHYFPALIRGAGDEIAYGPFPGGDPRDYRPDVESCTDAEIARWYRAAQAAQAAEFDGNPVEQWAPGCLTMGDGTVWTGTGLGIGTALFRSGGVASLDQTLHDQGSSLVTGAPSGYTDEDVKRGTAALIKVLPPGHYPPIEELTRAVLAALGGGGAP